MLRKSAPAVAALLIALPALAQQQPQGPDAYAVIGKYAAQAMVAEEAVARLRQEMSVAAAREAGKDRYWSEMWKALYPPSPASAAAAAPHSEPKK